MEHNLIEIISHDAFRFGGGLNKTAGEVYWYLLQEAKTASELCSLTGRSRRTVFRVLRRMSYLLDGMTGELIQMVEKRNGHWHAIPVDLDHIARIVGTAGKAERQRRQHSEERRVYHRIRESWREQKPNLNRK